VISRRVAVQQKVRAAMKQAINDSLFDLQSKSVPLAPLDEGDLRASANVNPAKEVGSNIEGTMGYDTPYAVRMHEDLTYTPSEPGTGPKFLENPANENKEAYKKHIADTVKVAFNA
jgi:hypothetical protein